MARIENNQGHYLELEPVAYQFEMDEVDEGDGVDNRYDLNWLEIRLAANDGNDQWTATDPALLNWEVTELINWLRQLAARDGSLKPSWHATEPCLECEGRFNSDSITLVASLAYEFWPPAVRAKQSRSQRTKIEFKDDGSRILKFAAELEKELQAFPIRGT